MSILDLTANDISCAHCKNTIERDLGGTPGVQQVEVDIDTKTVHVAFDDAEIDAATIRAKLDDIGYPVA
ncbi:MAG: cation transporter [Actinomycetota bacterium]|jgi:copper chaperone|nr:cation transporter [Actinomycetota bacterium]